MPLSPISSTAELKQKKDTNRIEGIEAVPLLAKTMWNGLSNCQIGAEQA